MLAVVPMAVGVAMGHPLQGSLYWALGVMSGEDDEEEETAQSETIITDKNGNEIRVVGDVDDQIHDEYRIHYLEEHLKELGKAIEEGCEVLAYCTWSFTDLLSWLNGYQKRYGFVYVDREEEEGGTLNRYKKDSFYWYQGVIKSDGENLYK